MIDPAYKLYKKMQSAKWNNVTDHHVGTNSDIQKDLMRNTPEAVRIAAPIAHYFKGSTDTESLHKIHSFIRKNLGYRRDPRGSQHIKLPNRFIIQSGDCKSNALFIYAIAKNLGIPVCYKFANYSALKGRVPSHVYNVGLDRKKNTFVVVDGTSPIFNIEKKPNYSITTDMRIMTLEDEMTITGRKKKPGAGRLKKGLTKLKKGVKKVGGKLKKFATLKNLEYLNKKQALLIPRGSFLGVVLLNGRGLASKLKKAIGKDPKGVKKIWESLGGSFSSLQKAVNSGSKHKALFGEKKTAGVHDEMGDEIGILPAAIPAAIVAAMPIITKMVGFIGKLDGAAKSPGGQKFLAMLKKNPKLKAQLENASAEMRDKIFASVAAKSGIAPEEAKQYYAEARQSPSYSQSGSGASDGDSEEYSDAGDGEEKKKTKSDESDDESKPVESGGFLSKIPMPVKIAGAAAIAFATYSMTKEKGRK